MSHLKDVGWGLSFQIILGTWFVILLPLLGIAAIFGHVIHLIGDEAPAAEDLRSFFQLFIIPLMMGMVFKYVLHHAIGGKQVMLIEYASRSRVRPTTIQVYAMMFVLIIRASLAVLVLIFLVIVPGAVIGEHLHWHVKIFFYTAWPSLILLSSTWALRHMARRGFMMWDGSQCTRFVMKAQTT